MASIEKTIPKALCNKNIDVIIKKIFQEICITFQFDVNLHGRNEKHFRGNEENNDTLFRRIDSLDCLKWYTKKFNWN